MVKVEQIWPEAICPSSWFCRSSLAIPLWVGFSECQQKLRLNRHIVLSQAVCLTTLNMKYFKTRIHSVLEPKTDQKCCNTDGECYLAKTCGVCWSCRCFHWRLRWIRWRLGVSVAVVASTVSEWRLAVWLRARDTDVSTVKWDSVTWQEFTFVVLTDSVGAGAILLTRILRCIVCYK